VAVSTPGRGRPRSEQAREAILDAAGELLVAGGLSGVSMDAVALRAGVSKATIYRWWPTKEELALDALDTHWSHGKAVPPDTGSLRGDLLALLLPWVRIVCSRPFAGCVAGLVSRAHADEEFLRAYLDNFVHPRRERARIVFDRAVDRGEIPPDAPVDVALDVVYGALYHRLLHQHAPLDESFAEQVVDLSLRGLLGTPPTSGRRGGRAAQA
jgi:AcrR family transcriptional regulator